VVGAAVPVALDRPMLSPLVAYVYVLRSATTLLDLFA